MIKDNAVNTRIIWVDITKIIACVLVVLGHFFQSMTKASILPAGNLYEWFNATIYYFHVPLFFICSGYLYQKYSKVNSLESWKKNIMKKGLALGVPYITFSTVTWLLKTVFSRDVNSQIGGLLDTLLIHPTAPYWYLYTVFLIFLITPTFSTPKNALIGLTLAFVAKTFILYSGGGSIYAISTVLSNEIWFVIGMCICMFDLQITNKKWQGAITGIAFLGLSVVVFITGYQNATVSFGLGLMACAAVILLVAGFHQKEERVINFLVNYTMPIFLMHTLFAAPLRTVIQKLGISHPAIHILLGLGISFIGPITAAWFMQKSIWTDFFLHPNRNVQIIKNR